MSDLIERDKAYEVIANYFDQIGYSRRYAKALINKVPSARPTPIDVTNVYKAGYDSGYERGKEDARLGEKSAVYICPYCRAKMQKESE